MADLQPELEEERERRGGWDGLLEEQKVSLGLLSLQRFVYTVFTEVGVHGVSGSGSACGPGGDTQTSGHVQVGVWELVGPTPLHRKLVG